MSKPVELTLPGGLERAGIVHRTVTLEPLNGYLEQAIAEDLGAAANLPAGVSGVLGYALRSVGGDDATAQTAAALCVADRQFLMLRLAQMSEGDRLWLQGACTGCGSPFDIGLNRSELPIKPAGDTYPFASVQLDGLRVVLRVPNGEDQAAIAELSDADALQRLLERLVVSMEPASSGSALVAGLHGEDFERIESALEEVAPAVCVTVQTHCPECDKAQSVSLDPYRLNALDAKYLYREVHTVAFHYHWGEAEILSLPRDRRHRYLDYIDAERGLYS